MVLQTVTFTARQTSYRAWGGGYTVYTYTLDYIMLLSTNKCLVVVLQASRKEEAGGSAHEVDGQYSTGYGEETVG